MINHSIEYRLTRFNKGSEDNPIPYVPGHTEEGERIGFKNTVDAYVRHNDAYNPTGSFLLTLVEVNWRTGQARLLDSFGYNWPEEESEEKEEPFIACGRTYRDGDTDAVCVLPFGHDGPNNDCME